MSKNLIDISRRQADQLVQQAEMSRGLLDKMLEHEREMEETKKEMREFSYKMHDMEKTLDDRFKKLEKNLTLTHGEAKFIKAKVAEKSYQLVNQYFTEKVSDELYHKKRCHFITGLYSMLNKHFNSITYTTIKHIDYENAMRLLENANLESLNQNYLRLTDTQKDTAARHGDYRILERLG
ncbi:ORF6C domain-containing protein [Staphylococcus sp. HMSC65H10]|uniref:ORF6C domain-containing protein n=1 Tax=Staphylococcus sp. HMSC65H10 TaxID=1608889 RepID=UPI0008A9BFDB|nr:ORF6C domain-containing protein [Staphylococcus sp. HMSC65H10]OHS43548.1 hypothetical protein HMPREF3270_05970 [Staphylococcus sp. HMSC65H10]